MIATSQHVEDLEYKPWALFVVRVDSLPAQRADCKLTAAAWSSAEQLEAIQAEAAAIEGTRDQISR
jgi:hypothetical protein